MKINPIDPTIRAQDRKRKDNDDAYLAFLRKQRSAFSGHAPSIAAHFRQAATSGIGQKPLYHAIPLTLSEHFTQHRIGQFVFASKIWWLSMVKHYQQLFIQQGGFIPKKYRV